MTNRRKTVTVMTTAPTSDQTTARAELEADYTPQYIQVAHHVLARIKGGTYPKLTCIPGSRALATELGVSQVVALHGLTVLVRAEIGRASCRERVLMPV